VKKLLLDSHISQQSGNEEDLSVCNKMEKYVFLQLKEYFEFFHAVEVMFFLLLKASFF
jgi:hypothetical protein